MILGDGKTAKPSSAKDPTLDELFRRAAARRPDAVALADPPDRARFTDGPPRRYTYAEADRVISAIAARLQKLGLQPDAVIGIQLPNAAESVLTLLGVLRAGLIAAPMPLLWRRADAAAALSRLGAKAIVTASRIDRTDHCDLAMQIAADVFPVRYVCGYGGRLADGIVPFDDLLGGAEPGPAAAPEREGPAASHVAVVTWDVTPDGTVAVARSHNELIAGGLGALLEGGLMEDARILGCCALASFAGMAATLIPWLLTGGTLGLHHPFDAEAFAAQTRDEGCDTVVLPGALVPQLSDAGLLGFHGLRTVLALWPAPERLLTSPSWRHPNARMIDLMAFGEIALLGARRDVIGRPDPLPADDVMAPRGSVNAVLIAEVARSPGGTLALRGPMVPRHAFPPGAERMTAPHLKADFRGFVDTRYSCRHDRDGDTFTVTAPPPGLVTVGGYRFVLSELEETARSAVSGAQIAALPDALAGHRLAGSTPGPGDLRAALAKLGVNPLLANAFGGRSRDAA